MSPATSHPENWPTRASADLVNTDMRSRACRESLSSIFFADSLISIRPTHHPADASRIGGAAFRCGNRFSGRRPSRVNVSFTSQSVLRQSSLSCHDGQGGAYRRAAGPPRRRTSTWPSVGCSLLGDSWATEGMEACGSSTIHLASGLGLLLHLLRLDFQIHLSIHQGGHARTDGFHHVLPRISS